MTVTGHYGSGRTPCNVFVYGNAYCVEGGTIVNFTREPIYDGVDVEMLEDYDCFEVPDPILSQRELMEVCDD